MHVAFALFQFHISEQHRQPNLPTAQTSQPFVSSTQKKMKKPCHYGKATGALTTLNDRIRDCAKRKGPGIFPKVQKKEIIYSFESTYNSNSLICLNDQINHFFSISLQFWVMVRGRPLT